MIDPYLIPNSNILKNNLNILDRDILEKAEADITYLKILDIDAWFEDSHLGYDTFLAVHKYIFEDLYEWAGQIRTVPIYKEEAVLGGLSLQYGEVSTLQFQIEEIIEELNQTKWNEMDLENTIRIFSDLIARLWLIHPFREGNTRTVMRYAGLFAKSKGFPLNTKLLREQANYVRNALVLYCVTEEPEKEYFLKIMNDAVNDF